MTKSIIKTTGFFSLYNGLSAALLRQATYSGTRFTVYETSKAILIERQYAQSDNRRDFKADLPFYQKIIIAGIGGGLGSIFGIHCLNFNFKTVN